MVSINLSDTSFRSYKQHSMMVSALDSGSSGLGSGPGWGAALCFPAETLNSQIASLRPGV